MKSNRVNYIIVGSFVLVVLIGLATVAAFLSGRSGAVDPYYAVYDNVTGVKYGTLVLYEGYRVGQVARITPQDQGGRMRFRVDFSVTEGWRIPEDSLARIAAPGLLSAVSINIQSGKSAKALQPGQQIRATEPANMLSTVTDVTSEIGSIAREDLRPLLANLNVITASMAELMQGDASLMVGDFRNVASELSQHIPAVVAHLENASQRLDETATRVNDMLGDKNRKTIEATLQNVASASADFARLSSELKGSGKQIDHLLGTIDGLVTNNKADVEKAISDLRFVMGSLSRHIENTNQNLEGTARNMYEFSRQIRQNPSLLLRGGTAPDQAAAP